MMEEQAMMEDIIVSLGSNEERERRQFNQDVNNFMAEIGKPLSKIPIMGYKELDLYQLFKEVMSYGGFNEVVKNVGTWSKIWKRLGNFDPSITDSSFRLKKNYERYLLEYEFKCFPDRRQQVIEHEKQVQMKKSHIIGAERPHSPTSLSNSSSSSDSSSPPKGRKRKHTVDEDISHDADQMSSEDSPNMFTQAKVSRVYEDRFSARTVNFETRDEMDDLESAVATLEALKHCVVY